MILGELQRRRFPFLPRRPPPPCSHDRPPIERSVCTSQSGALLPIFLVPRGISDAPLTLIFRPNSSSILRTPEPPWPTIDPFLFCVHHNDKYPKATKNFIKYSQKVEDLFTPYANCEDLIELFSKNFEVSTEDINALKRITKLLDNKNCTDSDLFFNASSRLYELDPSAAAADQMSKMSIAKGKSSDAIKFAKEAIEMEQVANQKAIYYLALADAYRHAGSYASARGAVYSALELRSGWGEAYMNLGNIYISGAKSCGSDFDNSTVYWVAVDAFKKALYDDETKVRASKGINTYSKYFPSKETCFFNGVETGKPYTVGCWINKVTAVRTSD